MAPTSHAMRVTIRSPLAIGVLLGVWAVFSWLIFPRPNAWPLAYVALVPLALVAVRGHSAKRVALSTYIAGVVWWIVAVAWLYDVALYGYLLLTVYLGLYPMGFALCLRAIQRRMHVPMFAAVPLVWVAFEYVRGLLFSGFPWFLLGHSQPTAVIQIADLAGAYGVSFVVASCSGLAVDLLTQPLFVAGRLGKTVRYGVVFTGLLLVFTLSYGFWRLSQAPNENAPAITVAVVQSDIPQERKIARQGAVDIAQRDADDRADFDALVAMTQRTLTDKPQLIVWPETIAPRALNDELVGSAGAAREQISAGEVPEEDLAVYKSWAAALDYRLEIEQLAREMQASMIVGAHAYLDMQNLLEMRYNSAYLFDRSGRLVDRFDKVHRVPFGEYVLFEDSLPWLAGLLRKLAPLPDYSLRPGERYNLLPVDGGERLGVVNTGAPICFEDVVSYVCRKLTYRNGKKVGRLLVNLTNDGWYPGRAEAPQHEQIARFRCIENRVPMARAVNRGVSGFIDSSGRIIKRVEVEGKRQNVAGAAVERLRLDSRSTIFGRIGDAAALGCLVITGILLLLSLAAGRTRKGTR